jgi:hypothetical protein
MLENMRYTTPGYNGKIDSAASFCNILTTKYLLIRPMWRNWQTR